MNEITSFILITALFVLLFIALSTQLEIAIALVITIIGWLYVVYKVYVD